MEKETSLALSPHPFVKYVGLSYIQDNVENGEASDEGRLIITCTVVETSPIFSLASEIAETASLMYLLMFTFFSSSHRVEPCSLS